MSLVNKNLQQFATQTEKNQLHRVFDGNEPIVTNAKRSALQARVAQRLQPTFEMGDLFN